MAEEAPDDDDADEADDEAADDEPADDEPADEAAEDAPADDEPADEEPADDEPPVEEAGADVLEEPPPAEDAGAGPELVDDPPAFGFVVVAPHAATIPAIVTAATIAPIRDMRDIEVLPSLGRSAAGHARRCGGPIPADPHEQRLLQMIVTQPRAGGAVTFRSRRRDGR